MELFGTYCNKVVVATTELSSTFGNKVATMELFSTFCCCNNGRVTKLQQWKKRKRKCTASLLRPPHWFAFTEIDPHDDDHDDADDW